MKLFHSPLSPYARKVMACAVARGIDDRIECIPTLARHSPPALLAANPLSKLPTLEADDGFAVYDSPVICEFLDSLEGGITLFPKPGSPLRWVVLRWQALADGIMDAGVARFREAALAQDEPRAAYVERQRQAMIRALDSLEADPPHLTLDIGTIAVGCVLGYLDYRFAADEWRATRPKLAAWYADFEQEEAMRRTVPPKA